MKRCGSCKTEKPTTEFYRNRCKRDGLSTVCKTCQQQLSKQSRQRNPRSAYFANLKAKFGITKSEYECRLADQGGGCAICGTALNLCLDHDHSLPSKNVRGILCRLHNVALGAFKDDAQSLRKAAEYLERSKDAKNN